MGVEDGKLLKTFTKEIKIHQKLKKHFNCCEKDKKKEIKEIKEKKNSEKVCSLI